MAKRARKKPKKPEVACDQWERGVCRWWTREHQQVLYCPQPRAANAPPGECCHHPKHRWRERLTEMSQAGVKLRRYGAKLKEEGFIARLWAAFLRKKVQSD